MAFDNESIIRLAEKIATNLPTELPEQKRVAQVTLAYLQTGVLPEFQKIIIPGEVAEFIKNFNEFYETDDLQEAPESLKKQIGAVIEAKDRKTALKQTKDTIKEKAARKLFYCALLFSYHEKISGRAPGTEPDFSDMSDKQKELILFAQVSRLRATKQDGLSDDGFSFYQFVRAYKAIDEKRKNKAEAVKSAFEITEDETEPAKEISAEEILEEIIKDKINLDHNATTIQSGIRGFFQRQRFKEQKEELEDEPKREKAAIELQRVARGNQGRKLAAAARKAKKDAETPKDPIPVKTIKKGKIAEIITIPKPQIPADKPRKDDVWPSDPRTVTLSELVKGGYFKRSGTGFLLEEITGREIVQYKSGFPVFVYESLQELEEDVAKAAKKERPDGEILSSIVKIEYKTPRSDGKTHEYRLIAASKRGVTNICISDQEFTKLSADAAKLHEWHNQSNEGFIAKRKLESLEKIAAILEKGRERLEKTLEKMPDGEEKKAREAEIAVLDAKIADLKFFAQIKDYIYQCPFEPEAAELVRIFNQFQLNIGSDEKLKEILGEVPAAEVAALKLEIEQTDNSHDQALIAVIKFNQIRQARDLTDTIIKRLETEKDEAKAKTEAAYDAKIAGLREQIDVLEKAGLEIPGLTEEEERKKILKQEGKLKEKIASLEKEKNEAKAKIEADYDAKTAGLRKRLEAMDDILDNQSLDDADTLGAKELKERIKYLSNPELLGDDDVSIAKIYGDKDFPLTDGEEEKLAAILVLACGSDDSAEIIYQKLLTAGTEIKNQAQEIAQRIYADDVNEKEQFLQDQLPAEEVRQFSAASFALQNAAQVEKGIRTGQVNDLDSEEVNKIAEKLKKNTKLPANLGEVLKYNMPHIPTPGISFHHPAGKSGGKSGRNIVTVAFNYPDAGGKSKIPGDSQAFVYVEGTGCYVRAQICQTDGLVSLYKNGKIISEEHKKGDLVIDTNTVAYLNDQGKYEYVSTVENTVFTSPLEEKFGGHAQTIRGRLARLDVKAMSFVGSERKVALYSQGHSVSSDADCFLPVTQKKWAKTAFSGDNMGGSLRPQKQLKFEVDANNQLTNKNSAHYVESGSLEGLPDIKIYVKLTVGASGDNVESHPHPYILVTDSTGKQELKKLILPPVLPTTDKAGKIEKSSCKIYEGTYQSWASDKDAKAAYDYIIKSLQEQNPAASADDCSDKFEETILPCIEDLCKTKLILPLEGAGKNGASFIIAKPAQEEVRKRTLEEIFRERQRTLPKTIPTPTPVPDKKGLICLGKTPEKLPPEHDSAKSRPGWMPPARNSPGRVQ
jgi:phage host-nuclease inhibitor protein Gam